MERLKKARAPIRGVITKIINEVETELLVADKNIIMLKTRFERLNELQVKIQDIDQLVLNVMLEDPKVSEDQQLQESIDCENILTRMVTTKLKIDAEVLKNEKVVQVFDDGGASSVSSSANRRRQYKLPKIELKKFSGKILDWLSWWAHFSKIHEDEELHATDKFQYLIQSMEPHSKGEDIVQGFPATEVNYPKVIEVLHERFGKKKLLIQVYVRELFKMGLNNINKKYCISSTYDKLICQVRALESLNISLEQSSLFLYPMVESSLPEDTLIAWQRSLMYEKDGSQEMPPKGELDYLLEFLRQEVDLEEHRSLARSNFDTKLFATYVNGDVTANCIFCKGHHLSQECIVARSMQLELIRGKINENKVCSRCFKQGHFVKQCKEDVTCTTCSKPHYEMMCRESQ